MSLSLEKVSRWSVRSAVALVDQGLFSGSNFILNVLMARWLSAEIYGAFAIVFAVYLFFTGIHNALILEPMAVLGQANYVRNLPQYMRSQLRLHFLLTGGLGLLIAGAGVGLQRAAGLSPALSAGIFIMGIGLPFMMLPWIVRRFYYLVQQPVGALLSSTMYSILLISGAVFLVRQENGENLLPWFGLMSLAGLLSSIMAIVEIGFKGGRIPVRIPWKDLLKEQWGFGKWVVIAAIFNSIIMQSQLFFMASIINLDSAGAWRALQNFNLPVLQSITAISALGMPALSGEFGAANIKALTKKGLQLTLFMVLLSIAYELILILFGPALERLLYDGKYAVYESLIPILGMIPILTAAATGYSLMLRALQRPSYYLVSFGIVAIFSLTTSIIMTRQWGIHGAAWSAVVVAAVSLLINMIYYRTWFSGIVASGMVRNLNLDQ